MPATIIHKNFTGAEAVHPAAFVQSTDPGNVGANLIWIDTSTGPPYVLKLRNATNTAWLLFAAGIAGATGATGATGPAGATGPVGPAGAPGAPLAGSGSFSGNSALSNSIAADITLTSINTFYDGPTLTLQPGTWYLSGNITLFDGTGAAAFQIKLWDGTTVVDSAQNNTAGANGVTTIAVTGYVQPRVATTYKVSAANSTRGGSLMKAAMVVNGAGNNASTLIATQIAPATAGTPPVPSYVNIQDNKSVGTNGGTFTNGAYRTRDLNTLVEDTAGIALLSANQITLPPGTYRFRIEAPAIGVGAHQARLFSITGNGTVRDGTSAYSPAAADSLSSSVIVGRVPIRSSTTFEVQHRGTATRSTTGFGNAASFSTEVYTTAEFWLEGGPPPFFGATFDNPSMAAITRRFIVVGQDHQQHSLNTPPQ